LKEQTKVRVSLVLLLNGSTYLYKNLKLLFQVWGTGTDIYVLGSFSVICISDEAVPVTKIKPFMLPVTLSLYLFLDWNYRSRRRSRKVDLLSLLFFKNYQYLFNSISCC
jgi:hypothetical protein